MKALLSLLLAFLLAVSLVGQTKIGGTSKVGGTTKVAVQPAPTGRAIVFNGSNQSATRALSGAPWNSLPAFKAIFRMRGLSSDGRALQIGGNATNQFNLAYSVATGRLDFVETRESAQIFHTPTDITNIVGRVQFDPTNSRWTLETWTISGGVCSGYVSGTIAITDTSNQNYDSIGIGASVFNSINTNPHVDWVGVQAGAGAMGSGNCPGAEPPAGTYYALWKFDADDGTDSSGNGLTLTLNNSPTFEDTP